MGLENRTRQEGDAILSVRATVVVILLAVALFLIFILFKSVDVSSQNGAWTDDRYDLHNSGTVNGTSSLSDPNAMYWLNESQDLYSDPIIIDIDGDGDNELIYSTLNGELFIRDSNTGDLIKNLTFDWQILNQPRAFQSDIDDEYRLVVVTTSVWRSRIHVVDLTDYSIDRTIEFNENISYSGRIVDIDNDGFKEFLFCTFNGYVYSYDLYSYRTEWRTLVHEGLRLPLAVFVRDGETYIAVTVGITFVSMQLTIGSTYVYGLRGADGEMIWSFDSGKYITTPPVVIIREGSTPECLVAFGTVSNTLYLIDFDANTTYMSLQRTDFDITSMFLYLSYLHDEGSGKHLLLMLAQRSCSALDIVGKRILWIEYFEYPNDRIDALCCNVDLDVERELVILNYDRGEKAATITVKSLLDGTNESHIEELPRDPRGLLFADFNNDGFVELAVRFKRSLVVFGNTNHVQITSLQLTEDILSNGSRILLYSMYRSYSIHCNIQMTTALAFVDYLEMVIDPDDLDIRIRYLPSSSMTEISSDHIIINDIGTTFVSGAVVFSIDILANWTFPHENLFGLEMYIRLLDGIDSSLALEDVFRVENDIVISGDLIILSDGSPANPGEWSLPSDVLEGSGLFLSYEGDMTKVPSPDFFSMQVTSGTLTWPVLLRDGCQLAFAMDLAHFTTGEYLAVIEFHARPPSIDIDTHSFTVLVDSEPVEVIEVHPDDSNWIVGGSIWLGVLATDGNGSGIDPGSVQVRIDLEDRFPSSDDWISFDSLQDAGDGLWEFLVPQDLTQGVYMFQWRLRDNAGNPYSLSQVRILTIDDSLIQFKDQYPNEWVNTTSVETGVSVDLHVSYEGMKVQYAVGSDPFALNDWIDVEVDLDPQGTTRLSVIHEFDEGDDNFIQWRVVINTTVNVVSGQYQIFIDTLSPYFEDPTPDLRKTFDGDSLSITIPVLDDGSGVDMTSVEYQLSSSIDFADAEWSTLETSKAGEQVIGFISLSGLTGKDNYIRFRALDNVQNPFGFSDTYRLGFNEPPGLISFTPDSGTRFEKGENVSFNAVIEDPDPLDEITIEWISDLDGHLGWGPELTLGNMSVGTHVVTIRYSDNNGNSRETILTIHIDPVPDKPDDRVTIEDNWNLILLIVVIAVVLITVLILRSRIQE